MKGHAIRLSPARRFICDLMWASASVPTVPVQRRMRLGPLVAARAALDDRPPWAALFIKGFALVADEFPELRRAFVKLPWPRLYEYPASSAGLAVERDHGGEKAVLIGRIKDPSRKSIAEIGREIRHLSEAPVRSVKDFRRALLLSRLPGPLRRVLWWVGLNVGRQRGNYFGTFGVTSYARLGAESLHPLSPSTATLNYGVIRPDGSVNVRVCYDHRVLDGSTVARALARLEGRLNGVVCHELSASASEAAEVSHG